SAVESALVKLIAVTDRLSQFEAKINTPNGDIPSLYTCQVRRDQVRALWEKVEKEYEACSSVISEEMAIDDITTIQAKYDYCYSVYERCAAELSEQIECASARARPPVQTPAIQYSPGCRLPPCDT
ncbi:hypothetical protein KR044_003842, partial [Drosophila immigrans]